MIELAPDTPIKTLTGRRGIVLTPPGSNELLPKHCLILFPSGDRQWVLTEIPKPAAIKEPQLLTLEETRINCLNTNLPLNL